MERLKTSEYPLIAFAMKLEMNIKELLPMACQDYDLNCGASWEAFDAKFNASKDTSTSLRNELESYLKNINKGFEKYKEVGKNLKNVTEWLNTDKATIISATVDFYLPAMYDLKSFPKEKMLSKIHWWLMRNKGMCTNVVNQARALGLDKVVVVAGANHRKYIQDIFKTMPDVKVRNINEME